VLHRLVFEYQRSSTLFFRGWLTWVPQVLFFSISWHPGLSILSVVHGFDPEICSKWDIDHFRHPNWHVLFKHHSINFQVFPWNFHVCLQKFSYEWWWNLDDWDICSYMFHIISMVFPWFFQRWATVSTSQRGYWSCSAGPVKAPGVSEEGRGGIMASMGIY
jgi:hypothetical protein